MAITVRIFLWCVTCVIMASLRFDDAVHVKPNELEMNEEGLFGVSWQTKTERKRRGTKFLVPDVSFGHVPWLRAGWSLFQAHFAGDLDRDFWVPELNTREAFTSHAPAYDRSLQWLVHCLWRVGHDAQLNQDILTAIPALKWHSCRVTLLDQAVRQGHQAPSIGLQANWKNPCPLVQKYARSRTGVSANVVKDIVADYKRRHDPKCVLPDDEVDDGEDFELSATEFFTKNPKKGSAYERKIHVCSAEDMQTSACGRARAEDCVHIGALLPDVQLFL